MGEADLSENAPLLHGSSARHNSDDTVVGPKDVTYGTNDLAHPTGSGEMAADEEAIKSSKNEIVFEGLPEVRKKFKYIVPSVGIGLFLAAADQTIVVASSGKIGSDLESLNNTSWIATAYFLTLTSIQPLYGKLSDIFGRRACLLFAYSVFGLGCLFCGLAKDMNQLIAARAFTGIGGGGMTTIVSIIMSDVVPLRERGTWQGILNIMYCAGSGSGAPLGGLMADLIGWRWSFLAQVPLCVVAIISVSITLNLPPKEVSNWTTKFRRIDFLGALTVVSAVFCFIFGMDRGANEKWKSAIALVPLCGSVPLFAIFVAVELKVAKEPFAPKHLIFDRSMFAAYMSNFFCFGGWTGALFYIPLYYQAVDRTTASMAGLRLLPGVVASVLGSLSSGLIIQKTGRYYWLQGVSFCIFAAGYIPLLLSSGLISNSTLGISIGFGFMGLGGGLALTASLIAVISNATVQDQAVATACSYLFRSMGVVFGLALSSTVIQQSLKMQLHARLGMERDADSLARNVRESLDYIRTLPPNIQEIVRECYGAAVRNGYILMMALAIFTVISSFFIKEKRISK